VYADLLGQRIDEHDAKVWLVNTGWTGGPYGVGHRFPIRYTRAILHAALSGLLDDVPTREHPVFRLPVPQQIPGVPDDVLDARASWSDAAAYDAQCQELAVMFQDNFTTYSAGVPDSVRLAGPRTDWRSDV
jgi:phosphoenolpyruvate carboxykinase (ATP)